MFRNSKLLQAKPARHSKEYTLLEASLGAFNLDYRVKFPREGLLAVAP
ncbi:hypothetical protein [Zobellia sp. OII3]|nr:hypothetical protein [Zobellia sp. OII3]